MKDHMKVSDTALNADIQVVKGGTNDWNGAETAETDRSEGSTSEKCHIQKNRGYLQLLVSQTWHQISCN